MYGKAHFLLSGRAVVACGKQHLLCINREKAACRKTSTSYQLKAVTVYVKFIHFVFLENVQQPFESGEQFLQLSLCDSSNGNNKCLKITELNMNHQT